MLDRKTAGSMKNYEEYQDEELIRRLRDGDGSVMDYLMENIRIWCGEKRAPCTFRARIRRI